jgi:hypothetical protein
MMERTYKSWNKHGYYVRRGEKATGRNKHNVPTFTQDQVEEKRDYADLGCCPDFNDVDLDDAMTYDTWMFN